MRKRNKIKVPALVTHKSLILIVITTNVGRKVERGFAIPVSRKRVRCAAFQAHPESSIQSKTIFGVRRRVLIRPYELLII